MREEFSSVKSLSFAFESLWNRFFFKMVLTSGRSNQVFFAGSSYLDWQELIILVAFESVHRAAHELPSHQGVGYVYA